MLAISGFPYRPARSLNRNAQPQLAAPISERRRMPTDGAVRNAAPLAEAAPDAGGSAAKACVTPLAASWAGKP